MKGYKKVSIEENNKYNQENNNIVTIINKNISIIILILVILIALFSILILYVAHQKKQIENKALFIKEIQLAVDHNLKKQPQKPKNLTEEIQNYEKTLRKRK